MTINQDKKKIVIKGEVVPNNIMSIPQFQRHLVSAKTLRGKLAVCLQKLQEVGAFSDSPTELYDLRVEMLTHLPDELK